jgi:hypothetical protein
VRVDILLNLMSASHLILHKPKHFGLSSDCLNPCNCEAVCVLQNVSVVVDRNLLWRLTSGTF